MNIQKTKLDKFQSNIGVYLSTALLGPWKRRSLGLITLLVGFYSGNNLTVYYLEKVGQRPLVVFVMVVIIEVLIRLRSTVKGNNWPLQWLAIDNFRIGCVYAVVLEAFKLGS